MRLCLRLEEGVNLDEYPGRGTCSDSSKRGTAGYLSLSKSN